jgi:hypothetical protein
MVTKPSAIITAKKNCSDLLKNGILATRKNRQEVLCAMAIMLIRTADGFYTDCSALLNSGAQSSCISQALVDRLVVKTRKIKVNREGTDQIKINHFEKAVDVEIMSRNCEFSASLMCLLLPNKKKGWVDCYFSDSRSVDLLIGGSLLWEVLPTLNSRHSSKTVLMKM